MTNHSLTLYVGNCTRQVQDFAVAIPEHTKLYRQRIEIGGQIGIRGLNTPQIEAIVRQQAKYGLVEVSEIDKAKPFAGLCWSVDKPISVEKLSRGLAHNDLVLVERGRTIRSEAAVSVSKALEDGLGPQENLKGFEASFVEQESKSNKDPTFAEGVRVDPNARDGAPPNGQLTRAQRRALAKAEAAAKAKSS